MNIEERAAQAAAWKAAGQCNCAQAVMKAFEDKIPVDADTLDEAGRRPCWASRASWARKRSMRWKDGSTFMKATL